MHRQRNRGTALALTAAISFFIMLVGIGVFYFVKIAGGEQELRNASDAGVLNVAKHAIQDETIMLSDGVEKNNFSTLAGSTAQVNLKTYNRIVAQTLLVALNAQAEGTTQAASNAQLLKNALQNDANNIGQRLSAKLSASEDPLSNFLTIALSNSRRLLNFSADLDFAGDRYQLAFVDPGDPTNVAIDPSILPPGASLPPGAASSKSNSIGLPFLAGYRDIAVPGVLSLQGAVVPPNFQPHLINHNTFDSHLVSPLSTGDVPPNAFRCAVKTFEAKSGSRAAAASCAIVGALNDTFEASIPGGYLMVSYTGNNGNAGNIPSLVRQVTPNAETTIIPQLKQRMREISPRTADDDLTAFLNSTSIRPGDTVYIYLNGSNFVQSTNPPASIPAGTAADGTPQTFTSGTSMTDVNSSVQQVTAHIQRTTTVSTTYNNNLAAVYTPSSGFNNFLGALALDVSQNVNSDTQSSTVDENYVDPPTTPTETPTGTPADTPTGDPPMTGPWDFFGSPGGGDGGNGSSSGSCGNGDSSGNCCDSGGSGSGSGSSGGSGDGGSGGDGE